MTRLSYKDAGIDLESYGDAMSRLPQHMHKTFSPRVLRLDGGFAGLFRLDFPNRLFARNYQDPVLVSGTDGVGTKIKVAQMTGCFDTVGIDLVAMCVNDIICCGAEPLFFLDYVAMDRDQPDRLEKIVAGISAGCIQADCALLGGETAIMPDLYRKDDFDLAGFCVGVVERRNLIDGSAISPDDVVIGIGSTGIHSNGFSLVRKIVFGHAGLDIHDTVEELGGTVGDALMNPTQIYAQAVRRVLGHYKVKNVVHGIAHITGGGIEENIGRITPANVAVEIDRKSWEQPPIFGWLQKTGDVVDEEMFRVFNMGIGLALIVSPFYSDSICRSLDQIGLNNWVIGTVTEGSGTVSVR